MTWQISSIEMSAIIRRIQAFSLCVCGIRKKTKRVLMLFFHHCCCVCLATIYRTHQKAPVRTKRPSHVLVESGFCVCRDSLNGTHLSTSQPLISEKFSIENLDPFLLWEFLEFIAIEIWYVEILKCIVFLNFLFFFNQNLIVRILLHNIFKFLFFFNRNLIDLKGTT